MTARLLSACCTLVLALGLAAPALARDHAVVLTLDGRPVNAKGVVAVTHEGVVFADMIALNKTFSGLMSITGKTYRTIIRGHSVVFTANSTVARFQGRKVTLPVAPFRRDHSLYVPLVAFGRGIATRVVVNAKKTAADIISAI